MKYVLYAALIVLYLLHNDLFLWNDECIFSGIPSGLLYHIAYCLASAVMMFLLVRYAWPAGLESEESQNPQ